MLVICSLLGVNANAANKDSIILICPQSNGNFFVQKTTEKKLQTSKYNYERKWCIYKIHQFHDSELFNKVWVFIKHQNVGKLYKNQFTKFKNQYDFNNIWSSKNKNSQIAKAEPSQTQEVAKKKDEFNRNNISTFVNSSKDNQSKLMVNNNIYFCDNRKSISNKGNDYFISLKKGCRSNNYEYASAKRMSESDYILAVLELNKNTKIDRFFKIRFNQLLSSYKAHGLNIQSIDNLLFNSNSRTLIAKAEPSQTQKKFKVSPSFCIYHPEMSPWTSPEYGIYIGLECKDTFYHKISVKWEEYPNKKDKICYFSRDEVNKYTPNARAHNNLYNCEMNFGKEITLINNEWFSFKNIQLVKKPDNSGDKQGNLEEEKKKIAEEKRKIEEEKRKIAEAKKKQEEEDQKRKEANAKLYVIGSGTGFFVSSEGHVVSNDHVVGICRKVATKIEGKIINFNVINTDEVNDLGLIKGDYKSKNFLNIKSEGAEFGEDIVAFGYPLSDALSTSVKLTRGIVSSLSGPGNNYSEIQIDAAIQPGNSGGPVLNMEGQVVGVASSGLNKLYMLESSEYIPENVNFAVAATTLSNFLKANGVTISNASMNISNTKELAKIGRPATLQLFCMNTKAVHEELKKTKKHSDVLLEKVIELR